MIKSENYGKITEIYRKIPLKTLKNLPSSLARRWGGGGVRLRRTGGDFSDFSMTGGFQADPPYLSLDSL